MSTKRFFETIDPEHFLWKTNGAFYSVACKKSLSFGEEQSEELYKHMLMNLVKYETIW